MLIWKRFTRIGPSIIFPMEKNKKDSNRPNILFITSDQQRGDCYGFAGRNVKTPHLDELREEGVWFNNCITPNAVCQPARASILTGKLPLTHGAIDNGVNLPPEQGEQGFAGQLGLAGYRTAFIGKAHFSTVYTFSEQAGPECWIHSAQYGPDWYGPYMGFKYVELTTLGHWTNLNPPMYPPHGQHYERWVHERSGGEAWETWKKETRPGSGAAQTWSSALPVALHNSSWVGDRTVEYLRNHNDNNPFCLWVSFPDPHHPFDCPEPWSLLHHPDEVDLPVEGTKDLDNRPWWYRASLEREPSLTHGVMKTFRKTMSRVEDQSEAQLREMMANYYGMISLIDHNVGRILDALEELGLAENTIVVYSSDHGDLLGDHGLYLKGPTLFEGLLRVGAIIRGPGIPSGTVVKDPVSTLDLAATFCDYGGTSLPTEAQSLSLRGLAEGRSQSGREVAYSEWNVNTSRCGVPLELRTGHTGRAKLTLELRSGEGELYNLEEDPHEMFNLFEDPGAASMRRELEEMIQARPGEVLEHFEEPVGMA